MLAFQIHLNRLGPAMDSIEAMHSAGLGYLLPHRLIVPEDLLNHVAAGVGATAAGHAAAPRPALVAAGVAAPAVRTTPVVAFALAPAPAAAPAAASAQTGAAWIGSKANLVEIDTAQQPLTFIGKSKETFDLRKFYQTPGIPASACAATLCSRSLKGGAAFCQHAGKKGHETAFGGAHHCPANFK